MRTSTPRCVEAIVDRLEPRRLLASSLIGSQLVVAGTTSADDISISYNTSTAKFVARINGVATSFIGSKVLSISVTADAGDDVVAMPSAMPATVTSTCDLGAGNDTFNGSNRNDTAYGRAGNDTLTGNSGDDNLYGHEGNDSLIGSGGNSDRIYPGTGNDFASGGSGNYDTLTYQDRSDSVTVRIDGGGASGNTGAGESDTVAQDFENAVGGAGNDLIIGNALANVIGGADGNDTLDGGGANDMLWGDGGIDTITYASRTGRVTANLDGLKNDGEAGELDWILRAEILIGGASHDLLTGDDNANTLISGAGNDTLDGGAGNDSLQGDNGRDSIIAANGRDRVRGGNHDDTIFGGSHADTIYGDAGNDWIDGGAYADRIIGGIGTDSVVGDASDIVTEVEATA